MSKIKSYLETLGKFERVDDPLEECEPWEDLDDASNGLSHNGSAMDRDMTVQQPFDDVPF